MGTSTKEKNTTQTTMLSTLPLVSITSSTHSAHRPPAFQLTTCAVVVTMDLTTGSDLTRTSAVTETSSAPTTSAKMLKLIIFLLAVARYVPSSESLYRVFQFGYD